MSERQQDRPRETVESSDSLQKKLDALQKVLGTRTPLPESMSQEQMTQRLTGFQSDSTFNDFTEVMDFNALLYRMHALQRQNQKKSDRKVDAVATQEFETVNIAQTYFEYLRGILTHCAGTSNKYLSLRRSMKSVPTPILEGERELEIFLDEVRSLLQERVTFSNASLVSHQLATQRSRAGEPMADQSTLVKQLQILEESLDKPAKAAIATRDRNKIFEHNNAIDQKIIDLFAAKGHLPAQLLISLQATRFEVLLKQQQELVVDKGLAKERAEFDALKKRNTAAKEGRGPVLEGADAARYLELQELLGRSISSHKALKDERRSLGADIVRTSDELAEYHARAQELTLIQHQFKSQDLVTDGTTLPTEEKTPAKVRQKMAEVTEMRARFHGDRLSGFVEQLENDVLTEGLPEKLEDFSNKTGREMIRKIGNRLATLATSFAPESLGIRKHLKEQLAGPMNDAMGWPVEKMDEPFENLTPEEQAEVLKRSKSIADAVREFRSSPVIPEVKNALAVIKALPPAKSALGEAPRVPLPELPVGAITPQNLDAMIQKYGLPTVYLLAIRQLDEAIGDESSGFIGGLKTFMDDVNQNIDIHLDVADALHTQSDRWRWWMYALIAGAVALLGIGALLPTIFRKGLKVGSRAFRGGNSNRFLPPGDDLGQGARRTPRRPSDAPGRQGGTQERGRLGRRGSLPENLDDAQRSMLDRIRRSEEAIQRVRSSTNLGNADEITEALKPLVKQDRALRQAAAESILGRKLTAAQEIALFEAHTTGTSLADKTRRLRTVFTDASEVTTLLRNGIAGDVGTVLQRLEATSALSSRVLQTLSRSGIPLTSELATTLGSARNVTFLERAFKEGGEEGAARAARYLASLSTTSAEALSDPSVVRVVLSSADDPSQLARAASSLTRSAASADECVKVLDDLSKLRRASSLGGRMLAGAGLVFEGAMLGVDIYELSKAKERHDAQIDATRKALDSLTERGLLEKSGDTYSGNGVTIDIKSFASTSATELEAQMLRTGVDAAALGTTVGLLFVSGASAGPAGLAVAGTVIVVHVGISALEGSIAQARRSEFLETVSNEMPWLLAVLGTAGTVGQSQFEVMKEHTGLMRSEVMPRSWTEAGLAVTPFTAPAYFGNRAVEAVTHNREAEKSEIREAALRSLCYQQLLLSHPQATLELPGAGDIQKLFSSDGEFLKSGGGYESFVRPFIDLQLRNAFVGNIDILSGNELKDISTLQLPDGDLADARKEDRADSFDIEHYLEKSARRAMLFYVQHLRELRYRKALQSIYDNASYDDAYKLSLIDQLNAEIERNRSTWYVFNVHPETLPPDGETVAQTLIREHMVSTESPVAGRRAARGYKLPGSERSLSLMEFVRRNVEPQHDPYLEAKLKEYAEANKNLPLSFTDLEAFGSDPEYIDKIRPTLRLLREIEAGLTDLSRLGSDDALKTKVEALSGNFDEYIRFAEHTDFYNTYSERWRKFMPLMTGAALENVRLLRKWKSSGYPTLIDEKAFRGMQDAVSSHRSELLPTRKVSPRTQLSGDIPGYEYSKDNPLRLVATLEAVLQRRVSPPRKDLLQKNPLDLFLGKKKSLFEFPFGTFDENLTQQELDYLDASRAMAKTGAEIRIMDGSRSGISLTDFGDISRTIAVESVRTPDLLLSLSKNDEFTRLRDQLLGRRVLVILSPSTVSETPALRIEKRK